MAGGIDMALLRAVRAEFAEAILPALGPEQRYTGAMMKRALDVLIAQAEAGAGPDAVLEAAGLGSPDALAARLRAERPEPTPELLLALRAHVEAKLMLSNPRFLAESAGGREKGDR